MRIAILGAEKEKEKICEIVERYARKMERENFEELKIRIKTHDSIKNLYEIEADAIVKGIHKKIGARKISHELLIALDKLMLALLSEAQHKRKK